MNLQLFFDNFDLLAEAPNGVQKLRELILQLAVQGKLVPQDPNNEPASELLERITRQREQLIKGKKLQKPKPLIPCNEEVGFNLPYGWQLTRLGHIFDFAYGKSLPDKLRNEQGKIPVYGSNGIVGFHDEALVTKPSLIVGRKGSIGAVNIAIEPFFPIDTTYYVTPPDGMDLRFSFYLVKSLNLARFDKATAIPGLNRQDSYSLAIALPPAEEQKRIATKVDELMKLCDELEERQQKRREARVHLNNSALEHLLAARSPDEFNVHWQRTCDNFDLLYDAPEIIAKLRQSILQLAVRGKIEDQNSSDEPASILVNRIDSEKKRLIREKRIKKAETLPQLQVDEFPYALPEKWKWVYLDRISNTIHYGYTASADESVKDVRMLRITDIQDNKVNWATVPGCAINIKDIENYRLNDGDIVIARTGGTIGKSFLVTNLSVCAVFASYLIRVVPNREVLPAYVKMFFESPLYWGQLYEKSMGTGQPNVNGASLRSLIVPIPPIEEQRRIVAKVAELMKLCDALESKLNQAQRLSESLTASVINNIFSTEENATASAALPA